MSNILIVGAGIAGLSCARALIRDGHAVRIVEQAPRFDSIGAGIVLQGNAMAALDAIGIGAAMRAAGHLAPNGGVFDSSGAALVTMSKEQVAAYPLATDSAAYYRPELHEVLVESVTSAEVHLGCRPRAITAVDEGVEVELDDGWSGHVDLVVGADGIHSQVRGIALGDRAPGVRYAGYTCWRAVASNPGVDVISETWGRGLRIGVVPLSGGRVYSFLVANAPAGGADDPATPVHEQLQALFAGFGGHAGEVVAALSAEATIMRHDIDELEDVVWGAGRLVLVGDAAHAMTPNMGQGAAQGIEDAIALALVLRDGLDEVPDRLRALRDRRVRQLKDRSRSIGNIAQWENGLGCWIRNVGTRLTPVGVSLSAVEATLRPGAELAARFPH